MNRIKQKFESNPLTQKIAGNMSWLLFDRIIRVAIGLFVGIWMARYLGPTEFGQLNYALAFVSLFAAISAMGLQNIVVLHIVQAPESTGATLGSAFAVQIVCGLLATSVAVITIWLLRPESNTIKILVVILSFTIPFKSTEVFKYWYESQVNSRYAVWVESTVLLLSAILKITLILVGAELIAFAGAILIEVILIAVGLSFIYFQQKNPDQPLKASYLKAQELLKKSWPLMLSGVAIIVYMRIDQLMLGQMLSDESVGIYSAATRISEAWYMFPIILASSITPRLIQLKKENLVSYHQELRKYFAVLAAISLIAAILITFSASLIIIILFGSPYLESVNILKIHIWTGLFVSFGVLSSHWYLLNNLNNYLFYRTVLGAVVNVLTNLILIPLYGGMGAAIATLFSQVIAGLLFDLISMQGRSLFLMKIKSIVAIFEYPLKFKQNRKPKA